MAIQALRHVDAETSAVRQSSAQARRPEGTPRRSGRAGGRRGAARPFAAPPRPADRASAPDSGSLRLSFGGPSRRARGRDEAGDDRGLRSRDLLSSLRRREGGEAPPPPITVRVCDSIACDLAGSRALLETLPALLGADVRVLHAPCVGRCETAPVAVVGQNPVPHATRGEGAALVDAKARDASRSERWRIASRISTSSRPGHIDYAAYRAAADMSWRRPASAARRQREDVIAAMERLRPARPRRRRVSGGPQVEGGRGRAGAAADGDQHRRGRAGHVQGSLLPRTRPAPFSRRRARRGLGGRASPRSTSTCATNITAAARF